MADIVVEKVSFNTPQAPGERFTVRVKINNLETTGPTGVADDELGGLIGENPQVCGGELVNSGHLSNVWLEIDQNGETVWTDRRQVCAPVQKPSDTVGGNPSVEFEPMLSDPGSYTVRAIAQVNGGDGPKDTTDPYALSVEEGATPPGDTSGGGGSPNPRNPDPSLTGNTGDIVKTVAVLVGLLAVAWMLSSVGSIAEVVS